MDSIGLFGMVLLFNIGTFGEAKATVYLKNANETEFYIRTFTSQKLDTKDIYGYINSKEKGKK